MATPFIIWHRFQRAVLGTRSRFKARRPEIEAMEFQSATGPARRTFMCSQLRTNIVILVSFPHPVKLCYVVGDCSAVTFGEFVGVQNVLDAADGIIQPAHIELALVPSLGKLAQLLLGMI